MLKHVFLALSISLFAVACGGGQEGAQTADDAAKKDAPAGDAKPADGAAGGDAAKPADGAPAGDAAKPADPAAAPK